MAPGPSEWLRGVGRTVQIERMGEWLRGRGWTLAVAESCTGGMIGARITAVSGSSDYFVGGVIAYANAVKVDLLGVREDVLFREGAVSDVVACAMAAGVRARLSADVALSVTGVAGPTGGTPDKPVGTVYIGLATPSGVAAEHFCFEGKRDAIRAAACTAALNLLEAALHKP